MIKRILIIGVEAYGNSDRSLALDSLAGALRKHTPHVVKTVNSARHPLDDVVAATQSFNPDVLCLSLRPGCIPYLDALADSVSLSTFKGTVIIGGLTASASFDILLSRYPESIVVVGEGEEALVGVSLGYDGSPDSLKAIPNLAYLDNGRIAQTPKRVVGDEYVAVSYDDATEAIRDGGVCWIESSRGCSYQCSFCSCGLTHFDSGWRPLPLEQVVEQLVVLAAKGIRIVSFADLNTFESVERLVDLAAAISEKPKSLYVRFDIRADSIYNRRDSEAERQVRYDSLKRLRSNGLAQVFVGYESCDASQLCRFSKAITPPVQEMALRILDEIGIDYVLGYLLFDPEMRLEDLVPGLDRLIKNGLLEHISTPLKQLRVQRGTPLEARMRKNGLLGDLQGNLIYYDYAYRDTRLALVANIASYFYHTTAKVYRHSYITNMLKSMDAAGGLRTRLEALSYRYKALEANLLYDVARYHDQADPEGYLAETVTKYVERRMKLFSELAAFYRSLMEAGFQYFRADMRSFCDYVSSPLECNLVGVDPADIVAGRVDWSF